MDPAANATHCTICKQPYTIDLVPRLERYPALRSAVDIMLLKHYTLCCFTLQGALLFLTLQFGQPLDTGISHSILATHIALQPPYFLALSRHWRVHNLGLYLRLQSRVVIPTPISYVAAMIYYAMTGQTTVGLLLYVLLAQYWKEHIGLLRDVNQLLLQI